MTSALPVPTVPIEVTDDIDVINVRRCCARLKMKHHASSVNSRTLARMDINDSI
jgi:hypothetical protein